MRTSLAALLLGLIVLIIHGQSLGIFYVQDDAFAYLASERWASFYGTITDSLQYRPNAWLITHVIDVIAPDTPWPLKLTGMAMLTGLGVALYALLRRLNLDWRLALAASALLVAHPGYYSMMNLYLSAAMTGLGVLAVMLSLMAAKRYAADKGWKFYLSTIGALVFCLTSYEAAIIALPLMMMVDVLYRPAWQGVSARSALREIAVTTVRFLPHIVLSILYLYLRSLGIAQAEAANAATGYDITADSVLSNLSFQSQNLFGIPYLMTFTGVPAAALWPLLIAPIAWLAFLHVRKTGQLRLWILSLAWMVLGFLPFILVGANGHSLHYVFFTIPGFAVLLALMLGWIESKNKRIAYVVFGILMLTGVTLNLMSYRQHVLTAQAYTGENLVRQFEAMNIENRNIVMTNLNFDLANRVHFGNTINILHRDNPYTIDFPQADWHREVTNPVVLHTELYADDPGHMRSRLIDITESFNSKAPWQKRGVQDDFIPGRGLSALSIRSDNPETRIEALWHDAEGRMITCTAKGALALPPVKWSGADVITIDPPSSIEVKRGFDMPDNAPLQLCSGAMAQ